MPSAGPLRRHVPEMHVLPFGLADPFRGPADIRFGKTADLRRFRRRPGEYPLPVGLKAFGMIPDKPGMTSALLDQQPAEGIVQGDIRAGIQRQVQIGESGRVRTETDLSPWRAARGAAGRMPPIGFPRNNRFG